MEKHDHLIVFKSDLKICVENKYDNTNAHKYNANKGKQELKHTTLHNRYNITWSVIDFNKY